VHAPVSRRLLVTVAAVAVAGFGTFGMATGADLTVSYVAIVVVLGVVLVLADRRVCFSNVVAVGVTTWAVAHLAGGLVELDGDRVLYNAVLLAHLRYDNVVHFFGFGVAGIAAWEGLSPSLLGARRATPWIAALTVWLFGMGIGAFNEVVEFVISLNVEESNIGGYLNTGRDLVANLLGSALAGMFVARRCAAG
jgi:uncharacterized membrane protein YjdF